MKLYIAEKPSVANDIAKALGGSIQKKNGYIEAGEDLVTWCYGHLLKTVEPESYNPDYKKWVAADLPLQLYPLRYEPIASNAAHTGGVSGNPRKFRHSALWNFLGGWSAA